VTPEQRATNRRTKTQRELERRERYRDALVGRRVGLKYDLKYDEDLEEYTGVVACRAFGIYNGSNGTECKEKYYILWDSEAVDDRGQWQVNDNPETLKGASLPNWPTIGTAGDWWVLPETESVLTIKAALKRKYPPSESAPVAKKPK